MQFLADASVGITAFSVAVACKVHLCLSACLLSDAWW